jgi:hypothetical protein
LQAVEQAVATQNVAAIVQACSRFTHNTPLFCTQVAEMGRQITIANAAVIKAQQAQPQIRAETTRLRSNASVSERPSSLHPNDTSGKSRAAEIRARADALEADGKAKIEEAKEALNTSFTALAQLLARISAADDEDVRKKEQAQMKLEQEATAARAAETRAKAIQSFTAAIREPDGKPTFATKNTKPSYEETLDFINAKLLQNDWTLRYGARTNAFLLIHPEGAYYLDLSSINPGVKYTTEGSFFRIQLESAQAESKFRAIRNDGTGEEKVRTISIPCNDPIDSEKLAKAFRHLILMAGGKDDAF